MATSIGVNYDENDPGDLRNHRQGGNWSRDGHVYTPYVSKELQVVPPAAVAGEVELMAVEAGNVWVTWRRGIVV